MRFFIASLAIHLAVISASFLSFSNSNFTVQNIGNSSLTQSISVSFSSSRNSVTKATEKEREEEKVEKKKLAPKPSKKEKKLDDRDSKKVSEAKPIETDNSIANTNSDLIQLSNGVYAAKNQGVKGLNYSFVSQPDPDYPLLAKRMGFKKEIVVKTRFLVGFDGEIEDIVFYSTKDRFGFYTEVEKALKKWKLTPVTLNGKPVKLYFYKEFHFNQIS